MGTQPKTPIMLSYVTLVLSQEQKFQIEIKELKNELKTYLIFKNLRIIENQNHLEIIQKSNITSGYKFHLITSGIQSDNKIEVHVSRHGTVYVLLSAFVISTGRWETYCGIIEFANVSDFQSNFSSITEKLK